MGTIIQFQPQKRQNRRVQETAQILLFVGVRYERWSDDTKPQSRVSARPKSRNRPSRQRA